MNSCTDRHANHPPVMSQALRYTCPAAVVTVKASDDTLFLDTFNMMFFLASGWILGGWNQLTLLVFILTHDAGHSTEFISHAYEAYESKNNSPSFEANLWRISQFFVVFLFHLHIFCPFKTAF